MSERKLFKDYGESDVNEVIAGANPANWSDVIQFVEERDRDPRSSTAVYAAHLIADARQAWKDNVPFPRYPDQTYRVLKSHRNPELVRQEEHKRGGPADLKSADASGLRRRR